MTGVVVDPLKGAKKGGAKGFARGLGTGLLGIVAKPVGGVVDLASDTLEGIASTPGALLDGNLKIRPAERVRAPRFISPTGCVVLCGTVLRICRITFTFITVLSVGFCSTRYYPSVPAHPALARGRQCGRNFHPILRDSSKPVGDRPPNASYKAKGGANFLSLCPHPNPHI